MPECQLGSGFIIGQTNNRGQFIHHRNIQLTQVEGNRWIIEIILFDNPSQTPTGAFTIECSYEITDRAIALKEVTPHEIQLLTPASTTSDSFEYDLATISPSDIGMSIDTDISPGGTVTHIGVTDVILTLHDVWSIDSGVNIIHDSTSNKIIVDVWP